jgi:uncharacterized protein (UPF0548 family)
LRAPGDDVVTEFLRRQENVAVSYAEIGQSHDGSPSGYNLDHNRALVGRGERDYEAACDAIREWKMFPSPWTKISPMAAPLREGSIVAMQAHVLGLWWLNACRIIYLVNDQVPVRRFGFAYGTMPAHVEQGEERFSVELHPDGAVWYDLRAFSRPRYWPVRLGKPLARHLQRRFVRESQASVREAVARRSH